jgi:DNA uptake protein ComE-like DNA-binding protein
MAKQVHQYEKTGKLCEVLQKLDKQFAMVKFSDGTLEYVLIDQLIPYDPDKGRLAKVTAPEAPAKEEEMPEQLLGDREDLRLNLNTATPEQMTKRLPGVGYSTAKKICELRMSLTGERFTRLEQLDNVPRLNWKALVEDDLIFV